MKCPSCSAPNELSVTKCAYCGTPFIHLNDYSNLEPVQFVSYLEDFIKQSRDEYDFQIVSFLLLLLSFWIGIDYWLFKNVNLFWFIFLEVLFGGVFFILWGLIIIYYEKQGTEKNFDEKITPLIHSYLIQKN